MSNWITLNVEATPEKIVATIEGPIVKDLEKYPDIRKPVFNLLYMEWLNKLGVANAKQQA